MKAFWDNLFYDLNNGGFKNQEEAAEAGGKDLRHELDTIRQRIKDLDPKEAIKKIDELMKYV